MGLDPDSLEVVEDVAVPGYPDTVVTAPDGRLLVVAEQGPTLVGVDPATGAVEERVLDELAPLGDRANLDAAVVDGQAWVTSHSTGRVHRLPAG